MRLVRLAWARSGDKGNDSNIGLVAENYELSRLEWVDVDARPAKAATSAVARASVAVVARRTRAIAASRMAARRPSGMGVRAGFIHVEADQT